MKNIYTKQSKIHGKGIFANRNFKRGEFLGFIKGKKITWIVKDKKTSLTGPNWVGLGKNHWIDPKPPFVSINHSCNPNAGIVGRVKVVALKPVKKDEEVMIDYSITESDLLWEMMCGCNSKNCRNKIKSIQSLPRVVYKKYLPFVPKYFKNIYQKHHKLKLKNG